MIGWLSGKVLHSNVGVLLVATNGVGYEVQVPTAPSYLSIAQDDNIELHIHCLVREDSQAMYGFSTRQELELFRLLIKVHGLGPALAMQLLGDMGVNDLVHALQNSDVNRLTSVKGVGRKTAERLLLEVGERLLSIVPPSGSANQNSRGAVISALENLGIRPRDAIAAVDGVLQETPDLQEAELLRSALIRTRSG